MSVHMYMKDRTENIQWPRRLFNFPFLVVDHVGKKLTVTKRR